MNEPQSSPVRVCFVYFSLGCSSSPLLTHWLPNNLKYGASIFMSTNNGFEFDEAAISWQ